MFYIILQQTCYPRNFAPTNFGPPQIKWFHSTCNVYLSWSNKSKFTLSFTLSSKHFCEMHHMLISWHGIELLPLKGSWDSPLQTKSFLQRLLWSCLVQSPCCSSWMNTLFGFINCKICTEFQSNLISFMPVFITICTMKKKIIKLHS